MANMAKGGFHLRYPGSGRGPRRYEVASSYGTALFPGDVCTLVTGGTVEAAAAGGIVLGVIGACSFVLGGERQYGKAVPATTVYAPTARGSKNATYVWVFDDPTTEYVASVATHAETDTVAEVYDAVGSNMDIVATAGNFAYNTSGHTLDGNELEAAGQFRILEIVRDPVNDLGSVNWKAVCMINEGFHCFTSLAGV